MPGQFVICTRCGYPVPLNAGVINCVRCFPPSRPRAEIAGTLQGLMGDPITKYVAPSPTIDVLDLDRSALRALEDIANG